MRLAAALILLVSSTTLNAAFTVQEENDTFALNHKSDRGYTNGTRFMWSISPRNTSFAGRAWGLCPRPGSECRVQTIVGIGQSMYTPENLHATAPTHGDRPYGGWLYGMVMSDVVKMNAIDHLEGYAGVIGSDAHAELTQKLVHRNIGAPTPMGWRNQIGEFAGLLVTGEHRVKAVELNRDCRPYLDVMPAIGAGVGNVFDYISANANLRAGYNLPPRFLRPIPAIAALRTGSATCTTPPEGSFDAYVFATAERREMLRNVFIDREDSTYGIRRNTGVNDLRIGVSVRIKGIRFQYAHTSRSAEFRPDPRGHRYGIITLSFGARP